MQSTRRASSSQKVPDPFFPSDLKCVMSPQLEFPYCVALVATTIAAITDLRWYRIKNLLTYPLFALGVLYFGVVAGWDGLKFSLIGSLIGFFPMLLLFLTGGFGAGDVKLIGGLGAWLGPLITVRILLISWLATGILSLLIIAYWLWWRSDRPDGDVESRPTAGKDSPESVTATVGDSSPSDAEVASGRYRGRQIPFGAMALVGLIYSLIVDLSGIRFLGI